MAELLNDVELCEVSGGGKGNNGNKIICFNYKIKNGDTLGKIAAHYGTTVQAIMRINPSIKNPDIIQVNSVIHVPGTGEAVD